MGKEDFNATIYADGKMTIPMNTRKLNNIEENDIVLFKVVEVTKSKKIKQKNNIKKKEEKVKAPI